MKEKIINIFSLVLFFSSPFLRLLTVECETEIPLLYRENVDYFPERIFLKRFRNFRVKLIEFNGKSYKRGLERMP